MNIVTSVRDEFDKCKEAVNVSQNALLTNDRHALAEGLLDEYYHARRVTEVYSRAVGADPNATDNDRRVLGIMKSAQESVEKDIIGILEKSIIIEDRKYRVPDIVISF